MNRITAALATIALGLVACGNPASRNFASSDVLFIRTASGIDGVSVRTGAVELSFPDGVASPDFEVVATTRSSGAETVARRLTADGRELTRADIPGELTARVVSGSGKLVALTEPKAAGTAAYLAEPRAHTRIVVLDGSGRHRELDLVGNFEPEAFSVNDRELFAIEYLPALAPERYRVRSIDIDTGNVGPIGRLKISIGGQMQGTGRTHAYSPDGNELYTLYTQQPDATGSGSAFIHQLNLVESWAHCIALPREFADGAATAGALAVDPIGTRLYVVDWTAGAVAVARPGKAKADSWVKVRFGGPDEKTFARVTSDRLYVAGESQVVVLDPRSLQVTSRWDVGGEVLGLALSPDERWLYASLADRVVTLDAATGDRVNAIDGLAPTAIEHVSSGG